MNAANTASAYKTQQIMTASPEELTLMLYNGAIRFASESMKATEKGEIEKAHAANMRAQAIVKEFMLTLDMKYDVSKNWMQLYEYVEHQLIQGNIHRNIENIAEAKDMLVEMRDTWMQAMKIARPQRAVSR